MPDRSSVAAPSALGIDAVFGLWADGGAVPEHAGEGDTSLARPVLGPQGLLDLLETMLGLSGPVPSPLQRIVAWQRKLDAAGPDRFWTASLRADPWATARHLLVWRDDLIDGGWDPHAEHEQLRLNDLATAERAGDPVPAGTADRLRTVEDALRDPPATLSLHTLGLIDRHGDLPPAWRRVTDQLRDAGVRVHELQPEPAAPADTCLGRLQRWMLGRAEPDASWRPDGTVVRATSTSTAHAAEIVRQWTATQHEVSLIAQHAAGHALDEALAAAGRPRFGASPPSPDRGGLQVLRLAFQLAWRPLDVHAAMDLLTLPDGPIPPHVANRLAAALEREPGDDGPRWQHAWQKVREAQLAYAAADHPSDGDDDRAGESARRRIEERLAHWQAWFDEDRADPDVGLPLEHATEICDRVTDWAHGRTNRPANDAKDAKDAENSPSGERPDAPLYRATARIAGDVRAALIALGHERFTRAWLDRIVDQALGSGERDPRAQADAGAGPSVTHPGAVWGPVGTVAWWNLRAGEDAATASPWTRAERAELAAHGCTPDSGERSARAAAAAWDRAVLHARDRIVLITAGLDAGSDVAAHPLAYRLAPVTRELVTEVALKDAWTGPRYGFAGVELPRTRVAPQPLPTARPFWPTPDGFRDRAHDRAESATSLQDLLTCPLRWSLQHVAGVQQGHRRSVPDVHRLLGTLAHALAAQVLQPGEPPAPDAARAQAEATLDETIDRLAVPLRYDQHAVQVARARERLPDAVAALARTLRDNHLTVVATERFVHQEPDEQAPEQGPPLLGFVDLIAHDANGDTVILDLKWTRSGTYRTDEIREGRAVQLATYATLLAPDRPARAGYYLLDQGEFLVDAADGLRGTPVDAARDLGATWVAVRDAWRAWSDRAHAGTLRARGVPAGDDDPRDVEPTLTNEPCKFCDFTVLCRTSGA